MGAHVLPSAHRHWREAPIPVKKCARHMEAAVFDGVQRPGGVPKLLPQSHFHSCICCRMTASMVTPQLAPANERDLLIPVNAEAFPGYDDESKTLVHEIETPDEDSMTCGFSWRALWSYAGPGWLMSIAYVDPGNLESDLQAGAYGGYQLIWVLLGATTMGYFLQVLAVRLGVVTGKNLAEMCTAVYPRWASLTLWIMTEIAVVGSDIQEVIGSSIAFQVLFGFPLWTGA
ncbi:hypothetical protein PHYPSEUDO_011448 [Phytophthora pseudosyringae]|uniref:Metal Ion (Mn2-iron) Transporter (Nramp) Family n=1 Tax=Phytophthora pseudosyringae TaxID=221518 RepID=A0A8T1W6J0_9STRA|nr:hypothetical protein PHYPSEUDO_011448 [Phytophthora pseudosyringae]